jgi:hypothetical protein
MKTLSNAKGDKFQQDMSIHELSKFVAGAAQRRQP